MSDCMLWRRLDTPGHYASLLTRNRAGWTLSGMAVFNHQGRPTGIRYSVELDRRWRRLAGRVSGFSVDPSLAPAIRHDRDGWRLDGVLADALGPLADHAYGFPPRPNRTTLRGERPKPGAPSARPD